MSLGDFLSGIGEVFQTGIQTLPAIIQAGRDPLTTTLSTQQFPGIPSLSLTPGGVGPAGAVPAVAATAAGCPSFVPTRSRLRAVRELRAVNPTTNRIESWTHRGSPIIWSGDRAIAKSYAKAAGFTLKRRGGSHRHTATRRRKK